MTNTNEQSAVRPMTTSCEWRPLTKTQEDAMNQLPGRYLCEIVKVDPTEVENLVAKLAAPLYRVADAAELDESEVLADLRGELGVLLDFEGEGEPEVFAGMSVKLNIDHQHASEYLRGLVGNTFEYSTWYGPDEGLVDAAGMWIDDLVIERRYYVPTSGR